VIFPARHLGVSSRLTFFQGGFLDGWRGLVIAVSNFNGTFFKYMKIYADKATGRRAG
jgi:hypothetical protein